jgi:hypothetical protein
MQLSRSGGAPLAFAAALMFGGLAPLALHAQTPGLSLVPPDATQAPKPVMSTLPPITIRIAVAFASEDEGKIDPSAHDIFRNLPAKYRSIQMIDERTIETTFGEQTHVALKSGTEIVLLPIAVHGGQLHLQLEMPEVLNTSMRMSNSRAFYVGGVPHQGGTLIFKLVPDFTAYIEPPARAQAASPETRKATGKR